MSLFRFKIWWMIPATGVGAAAVPAETQMLLLEYRSEAGPAAATERGSLYALVLPVLDGGCRASLHGRPQDELQVCFPDGGLRMRP